MTSGTGVLTRTVGAPIFFNQLGQVRLHVFSEARGIHLHPGAASFIVCWFHTKVTAAVSKPPACFIPIFRPLRASRQDADSIQVDGIHCFSLDRVFRPIGSSAGCFVAEQVITVWYPKVGVIERYLQRVGVYQSAFVAALLIAAVASSYNPWPR